jgi:hypothetical protein
MIKNFISMKKLFLLGLIVMPMQNKSVSLTIFKVINISQGIPFFIGLNSGVSMTYGMQDAGKKENPIVHAAIVNTLLVPTIMYNLKHTSLSLKNRFFLATSFGLGSYMIGYGGNYAAQASIAKLAKLRKVN